MPPGPHRVCDIEGSDYKGYDAGLWNSLTAKEKILTAMNTLAQVQQLKPGKVNADPGTNEKFVLDRHRQEKHRLGSGCLLCPVGACPRSIHGEGFNRMDHLIHHLISKKHDWTREQAEYEARVFNSEKENSGRARVSEIQQDMTSDESLPPYSDTRVGGAQSANTERIWSDNSDQKFEPSSLSIYPGTGSTALRRLSSGGQHYLIDRFTEALAQQLHCRKSLRKGTNLSSATFQQRVDELFKTYLLGIWDGDVKTDSDTRQTAKRICDLRHQICDQFMSEMLEDDHHRPDIARHADRVNKMREKKRAKVTDWHLDIDDFDMRTWDTPDRIVEDAPYVEQYQMTSDDMMRPSLKALSPSPSEPARPHLRRKSAKYAHNIETRNNEIYNFLTFHPAFFDLASELENLVELTYCDKMETIRQRVSNASKEQTHQDTSANYKLKASFRIFDWDIRAFLYENYPDGLSQDLGLTLAITGQTGQAYLSTIHDYFRMTWPEFPQVLLTAIQSAVSCDMKEIVFKSCIWKETPAFVSVYLTHQEVFVSGSEEFIVIIAQQLAWLVASCRATKEQLAHSFTSFRNLPITQNEAQLKFTISAKTVPFDDDELEGCCWHPLAGRSVVVTGFPIPDRYHDERGLEIPLEIMAYLGGAQIAVRYENGYLLKGRSIMLVPVERKNNTAWKQVDSVQWHLVQKSGRIRYQDVLTLCPNRLDVDALPEESLKSTRAFLGWCSNVVDNIGTLEYDYSRIEPSQARDSPQRLISPTEASFGFSYFASGSLTFAPGRHNAPFRVPRSTMYHETLEYARQIPVILYDTLTKRAWQTDAERAILHILVHRQIDREMCGLTNQLERLKTAIRSDPQSVRRAMVENAELALLGFKGFGDATSIMRREKFGDHVERLFSIFEGLQEHVEQKLLGSGWKMSLDRSKYIQGYEYMDLLSGKRELRLKKTILKKTCGDWPDYAESLNSVILFGKNFGEIFQPDESCDICKKFVTVPAGNDYLTIRGFDLREQFYNCGSAEDQLQLTTSGVRWHRSPQMFGICGQRQGACKCDRIQELVPEGASRRVRPPGPFPDSAALIFGQVNFRFHLPFPFYDKNISKPAEPPSRQPLRASLVANKRLSANRSPNLLISNQDTHHKLPMGTYGQKMLSLRSDAQADARDVQLRDSMRAQADLDQDEQKSEVSFAVSRYSISSAAPTHVATETDSRYLTSASSIDTKLPQLANPHLSIPHAFSESSRTCWNESVPSLETKGSGADGQDRSQRKAVDGVYPTIYDGWPSTSEIATTSTRDMKGKGRIQSLHQPHYSKIARRPRKVIQTNDVWGGAISQLSGPADSKPEILTLLPEKRHNLSRKDQGETAHVPLECKLDFWPSNGLLTHRKQHRTSLSPAHVDQTPTYSDLQQDLGATSSNLAIHGADNTLYDTPPPPPSQSRRRLRYSIGTQ